MCIRDSFNVASVVVSSFARLVGLNEGTVAPKKSAFSAISSESVVTTISSIFSHCFAANIGQAISGLPLKIFIFLPGSPLEPPLAGIIQIVFNFFSSAYTYIKLLKNSISYGFNLESALVSLMFSIFNLRNKPS